MQFDCNCCSFVVFSVVPAGLKSEVARVQERWDMYNMKYKYKYWNKNEKSYINYINVKFKCEIQKLGGGASSREEPQSELNITREDVSSDPGWTLFEHQAA